MQRFSFLFFYSILLVLLITGCEDDDFREAPDGFSYKLYQQQRTPVINEGDYVLYHADYASAISEEVFFTTRTKDLPNLRVINPRAERTKLEHAMAMLHPGDSLTILIGSDQLNRRLFPPTINIPDLVHIHLKVYDVFTERKRIEATQYWLDSDKSVEPVIAGVQKKIIQSDTSAHKIRPGDEVTYRIEAHHLLPDWEIPYQLQNRHTSVIPEVTPPEATPVLASILTMRDGDKAEVLVFADSLNYKLPGAWPNDRIVYHIKIESVKSLEQRLMSMEMQERQVLAIRSEAYRLLQQAVCDWVEGSWAGDTSIAGMHILKVEHAKTGIIAKNPNKASVHYMGFAEDCLLFAESFEKIEPLEFELHQGFVIRGWDVLMESMRPGDHWLVRIPPNLAFGASGFLDKVEPNAVVWYYIWRLE